MHATKKITNKQTQTRIRPRNHFDLIMSLNLISPTSPSSPLPFFKFPLKKLLLNPLLSYHSPLLCLSCSLPLLFFASSLLLPSSPILYLFSASPLLTFPSPFPLLVPHNPRHLPKYRF